MSESHPGEQGIRPAQEGIQHGHGSPPGAHGIQEGHAGQPAGPPLHFTWEEWQQFQRSDLGSGGVVVALMASIFTIGLLLYGTIAYLIFRS
jgi:hypothetical protein